MMKFRWMQKKVSAWLSLLCAVAVLLASGLPAGTVWAAEAAEDSPVLFDFESGSYTETATDDGLANVGWNVKTVQDWGNTVLQNAYTASTRWETNSSARLNNADGAYTLESNSRYLITLKIRVLSNPQFCLTATESDRTATAAIGYGMRKGSDGNPLSSAPANLMRIYSGGYEENEYTLTDSTGSYTYPVGEEWHELACYVTTGTLPEDKNNHLGLSMSFLSGTKVQFDDVRITKLGAETGVVLARDFYSDTLFVKTATISESVALPETAVLKEKAAQEDHTFLGFVYGETTVVSLAAAQTPAVALGVWDAPVSITYQNTDTGSVYETLSGQAGQAFEAPADLADTDQKWFMGFYETEDYTDKFTATRFGKTSQTVYSRFEEKEESTEETYDFTSYRFTAANEGDGAFHYSAGAVTPDPENGKISISSAGGVYAAVANGEKTCTLDGTSDYLVRLRYTVHSAEKANLSFGYILAVPNNRWGNQTNPYTMVTVPNASLKIGESREVAFLVSSSNAKHPNAAGLYFSITGSAAYEMDVEEVTVTRMTADMGMVTVDLQDGSDPVVCVGHSGEPIPYLTGEVPQRDGYRITGFFRSNAGGNKDQNLGKGRVTETVFAREQQATVYACWTPKSEIVYSFDTYGLGNYGDTEKYHLLETTWESDETSNGFLRVTNGSNAYFAVAEGTDICSLKTGGRYLITVSYKVLSKNGSVQIQPLLAGADGRWTNPLELSYQGFAIPEEEPTGETRTGQIFVDVGTRTTTNSYLYLIARYGNEKGNEILIDEVRVETLPASLSAAVFYPRTGATPVVKDDPVIQIGYESRPIESVTLSEVTGYRLGGWYTDKAGTQAFAKKAMTGGSYDRVYAGWVARPKTVFVPNGGSLTRGEAFQGTAADSQTVYADDGQELTAPTLYKTNAEFGGWYETDDFSGEAVTAFEADRTYYAKWLENTVGFENFPYPLTQTASDFDYTSFGGQYEYFVRTQRYALAEGRNGGNSLRLDTTREGGGNNKPLYRMALLKGPTDKTAYKVTFWYCPDVLETDLRVIFATTSESVYASLSSITLYEDAAVVIPADAEIGVWQKAEVYLTTDFGNSGTRYLSMFPYVMVNNKQCAVRFDDFTFTPLESGKGYVKYYDKYEHSLNAGWQEGTIGETAVLTPKDATQGRFFISSQYALETDAPTFAIRTGQKVQQSGAKNWYEVADSAAVYWGTARFGDADFDGIIGINDITRIKQVLLKEENDFPDSADLNRDGRVDVLDLVMLRHMLVGESYQSVLENAQNANSAQP